MIYKSTTLPPVITTLNKSTPPELLELLILGIMHIPTTPLIIPDHLRAPILNKIINEQNIIGWNHLTKGIWTSEWINVYNDITATINGLRWSTTTLRLIWKHIYQIWKNRCPKHHDKNHFETQRVNVQLDQEINAILTTCNALKIANENTTDELREKLIVTNIPRKEQWVKANSAFIRKYKIITKNRVQRSTIHTYLQNNTNSTPAGILTQVQQAHNTHRSDPPDYRPP
jgi:hypothetical protein